MSTTNQLKSRLSINGLKLNIYFGWPEDERLRKQWITLDIILDFPQPPTACQTDQLEDTFCYSTLAAIIRNEVGVRHYRLVEHLAREIYLITKTTLAHEVNVGIAITKYPSTIPDLQNGVTFHYGDI